jgi:hypothetical protein
VDAKSGGCIFILHYSNSLVRTSAESKYAKEGLLSSSDAMDNLLGIRRNMMDYVRFIDTFAPCVLSCSVWNDRFLIENACSRGYAVAFHGLFSVCDEGFLLAVFVKHAERWSA